MADLCKLLYHLSPYHTNFKSRGFKVDDVWKFSAGLKSKIAGRKDEPLTVDFMKATIVALNTLNLETCLVTEPFANSDFVVHLSNLLNLLEGALKDMEDRAGKEKKRAESSMDSFATRRAEPGSNLRKLTATCAVASMHVELDSALRAHAMDSPLSLEMFEPVETQKRVAWYRNLALSVDCWDISFDVPGNFGALHWFVKIDSSNLDRRSGPVQCAPGNA